MDRQIRSIALVSAIVVFFLMASISSFCAICPATCCSRAIAGSLITYLAVRIVARVVMAILIHAMAENKLNKLQREDKQ